MDTFKFWAAFSVGVAAGAVVALICAPQSGEKTRKQLRRKLEDAGEYVKDTASDLGDKANKAYKKGRESVSDYSDDLVSNLQSAAKEAQSRF
jgi:gas vesicle protein